MWPHRYPFLRIDLDVLPPHVRERVESPTLLKFLMYVLLIRL
jgi:hypothetical protein